MEEAGWVEGIDNLFLAYKDETGTPSVLRCGGDIVLDLPDRETYLRFSTKDLFLDWRNPTDDERLLFELEYDRIYPSQELLDYLEM